MISLSTIQVSRPVMVVIIFVVTMTNTSIKNTMANDLKRLNQVTRIEGADSNLTVEEIKLVSDTPFTLADKETQVTVKKLGSVYSGIAGTPLIKVANQEIEAISTAVFANKGYIFNVSKPYECVFHGEIRGDVGINFVDSCFYKVTTTRKATPTIIPGNLSGELTFPIEGPYYYYQDWRTPPLKTIQGTGGHFVKIRITGSLGRAIGWISFQFDVITNFGIQKVDYRYNAQKGSVQHYNWEKSDTTEVIIGPERISIHILPISTPDSVSLKINVLPLLPEVKQKEAIIIRYND